MTELLAYADEISVAPGDTVRFMVSCRDADRYDARIVRLINPEAEAEATPFRTEPVDTPASFTLQAMVWPTTPLKGRQAILGAFSETEARGFVLGLDASGALEVRTGDGAEVAALSSGRPLLERRWYLVAASFDATTGRLELHQEPLHDPSFHAEPQVHRSLETAVKPDPTGLPFLIAAWQEGTADTPTAWGRTRTGGHYNGKIDRPRLAGRALDRAGIASLAAGTPPSDLADALIARWDFSENIPSDTLVDTSPNRLHAEAVNLPARAMTGHNWTGEVMDWTAAPDQYGAVHFHDDDLVDACWQEDFSFEVPFFVRPIPGTANAKIAFLASTATYIVYMNNRGRFTSLATEHYHGRLLVMDAIDQLNFKVPGIGVSTYDRHSDGSGVCFSSRHRRVTNVRPSGRHWNFNLDLFIVDWLEHLGVAYDVITEEDLHEEGADLLRPYSVVLTGSHPEYDSAEMLDALDGYLRRGGRFMYMGGNGFYWRIAHHPTRRGVIEVRRAEGGVRAWDALPGEYYHQFTGEYGGLWRRQGRAPQKLAGVGFISQGFDHCSHYRRTEAAGDPRVAFMMEGVEGELIGDFGVLQGGAAGLEIDSVDPALGTPPHALVVARSENHSNAYMLVAEEVRIPHGATDAVQNEAIHADITFFETPNGGAVFSTGSIAYAGSLSWNGFDNNLAKLSTNVLLRFADDEPFTMPDG
jgi:N,N-dimethylformamidase